MGTGGLAAGSLLLGAVLLVFWIVILVWLSQRLLRIVARGTGWRPTSWRAVLLTFVTLLAAVHFGNWIITLLDGQITGQPFAAPGFPPAFLIGSIAIGVGVAMARLRGRS